VEFVWHFICVGFIAVFLVFPTWLYMQFVEWKARKEMDESDKAGRLEPVTITPLIDERLCMGSATCVRACPEHVLGIVDGQAVLINTAACIGHGVCVPACPVDAIELVFGSEKRGIDIPEVGSDFQTNVPGLYVAGELGGMGLIANAVEQGVQSMRNAAKDLVSDPERWDVVIIGAGPAGIGAGLVAKEAGLRYFIVDQDDFGGAIRHYPRKKLVFIRPIDFPTYGRVKFTSLQKEELVSILEDVIKKSDLEVHIDERVEEVIPLETGGFQINTIQQTLYATKVILAIGRAGTPKGLGVPGEDQEKVAYWLRDPEMYSYEHLLVVGGGDSAVEAAMALGEQAGNRVYLSYRAKSFTRPKKKNVEKLRKAVKAGQIQLVLESQVTEIGVDRVVLKQNGEELVLPNDYCFVFAGGVLPTEFLRKAGIKIKRHHGKKIIDA
jgi:thioredoxin reductase (NADPH)